MSASQLTVQAAGTCGNFGPGFDAMSLALAGLGDTVTIQRAEEDAVTLTGEAAATIPTTWRDNVAGVTIDALRRRTGDTSPYRMVIDKAQPGGSGLGSSASSAGGAALAYHRMNPDAGLEPVDLIRAAGEGEGAAAGTHYDDVAAVVLGGLAIVAGDGPSLAWSRVQPPDALHLAIVRPALDLPTRVMRELLPDEVKLADAVHNLAAVARLVEAMRSGDVATIGASMSDRLVAPRRRTRLPHHDVAQRAALDAGAFGVTISGSGPSMLAVCDGLKSAAVVANAMAEAVATTGVAAVGFHAQPERGRPYAL